MKTIFTRNESRIPFGRRGLKSNYRAKETIELFVLTLPAVLLLLIFAYWPMFGVIVAFKRFNPNAGILASEWVGFQNFEFFFSSQDAWRVLRNTVLYGIDFQIVGLVSALALAILMYNVRSRAALKFYQTSMILPKFISMVLVAYITYAVLNPVSGIANQLIRAFGGNSVQWYSEPKYWPFILTIVEVWKTVGMNSIVYYAAMMGIDETLFEAARIDGANRWQEIRHIMLPELSSVICILLILGMGGLISGDFGLFYQVPMNIGVLYPTTDIINTYTFRGLMSTTNWGMTSAVGLFQSVISLILIVGSNLIIKKIEPANSLF